MKFSAQHIIASLAIAFVMLCGTQSPAQARVLDWVGMITNKSVEITDTGFDTDSINVYVKEDVVFYNESGRTLRVVAKGIKLSTQPIPNGSTARMRFPRRGTFTLFCDKPCKKSMDVIVGLSD